jgi:hypothetical protein
MNCVIIDKNSLAGVTILHLQQNRTTSQRAENIL